MKSFTTSIMMLTLSSLLSAPATAFQLKIHEVDIVHKAVAEIPIANTLNTPIIVRITPPDGVQVFPRRFQLLPGERQLVKARERWESLISKCKDGILIRRTKPRKTRCSLKNHAETPS